MAAAVAGQLALSALRRAGLPGLSGHGGLLVPRGHYRTVAGIHVCGPARQDAVSQPFLPDLALRVSVDLRPGSAPVVARRVLLAAHRRGHGAGLVAVDSSVSGGGALRFRRPVEAQRRLARRPADAALDVAD